MVQGARIFLHRESAQCGLCRKSHDGRPSSFTPICLSKSFGALAYWPLAFKTHRLPTASATIAAIPPPDFYLSRRVVRQIARAARLDTAPRTSNDRLRRLGPVTVEVPSGRSTGAVRMLLGQVSTGSANQLSGVGLASVSGRLICGQEVAGSTSTWTDIHHLSNRSPECRLQPRYDALPAAAADEAATVKARKMRTRCLTLSRSVPPLASVAVMHVVVR